MNETDLRGEMPVLRPWVAPHLTTLDISQTSAGASPNIQETQLTDASLLS